MSEVCGNRQKRRSKLIIGVILSGIACLLLHFYGREDRVAGQTINEKRYTPKLVIQTGSLSLANTVAVSRDGKTAAFSGGDGVIRLIDFESGLQIDAMVHPATFILSVAFSPDGKILASGGFDKIIKLWDVKTGSFIKSFEGHEDIVSSIAFSPDGKTLASGSQDQTVRLWDVATGESRVLTGHTESAFSVAFSRDGTMLASGSPDKTIRLWNPATGELIKKLEGSSDEVWSVAFSSDRKTLASSGRDNTVRIWNVETGEFKLLLAQSKSIYSSVFSPDGKTLAVSDKNSVSLWDVEKGERIKTLEGHTSFVRSLAFSPDGTRLISVGSDNQVKIWDAKAGEAIITIENHTSHILAVAISPDEKLLATVGFNNKINIWNLVTGTQIRTLEKKREKPTIKEISAIAFSPDGAILASDDQDNNVNLWNVSTGEIVKSFKGHTQVIHSITFSRDGKMLASASEDATIRLWNAQNGQLIKLFSEHEQGVTTVAFSSDGKTLVSGSKDKTIKLWDIATKNLRKSLTDHQDEISAVKLSADGTTLFSASFDKTVKIWNILTGQVQKTLSGHDEKITSLALSSDEKTLVSGDRNGDILRWDLKTGNYKLIKAHWREISSIIFVPGRNLFISGSWDGTTRLWRTDRDAPLATLFSLDKNDWAVIAPDNSYDISPNAEKLLCFVVSDPAREREIITLNQLKQHYEPNLLKRILAGRIVSQDAQLSVTLFPDVKIEHSKQKASTLDLTLTNRGGGVGHVEVRINGSELTADASDGKYVNTTNPVVNLSVKIPVEKLREGENDGEIVVWNGEGDVRSNPQEFILKKNGDVISDEITLVKSTRGIEPVKPAKKPKSFNGNFYAIIAGISEYADEKYNLRYAAKDAEDMTQILTLGVHNMLCGEQIKAKKLCERVHLRLLSTEKEPQAQFVPPDDIKQNFQRIEPTKQNFKAVFAEIAKKALPDDIVVIYFAGHGMQGKIPESKSESGFSDIYLYATSDADTLDVKNLDNKSKRESMTVSSLELSDWVNEFKDGIAAKKKAIIFDTCAAGAVREDLTKSRSEDENNQQIRALGRLNERSGLYVLMGSASDAESYEASDYRQGLLTYALIESIVLDKALEYSDGADKGRLEIENWFVSVGSRVEELAEGVGGIQRPSFFKKDTGESFAESFPIGLFGASEKQSIPRATIVPMLLQPELSRKGNFTDDLRLREKLETELRKLSGALKRGEPTAFNYVNAKVAAKGWTLRGDYVVVNGLVTVSGRLVRDEKMVIPFKAGGKENEIVGKIVAEIQRIVKDVVPKMETSGASR